MRILMRGRKTERYHIQQTFIKTYLILIYLYIYIYFYIPYLLTKKKKKNRFVLITHNNHIEMTRHINYRLCNNLLRDYKIGFFLFYCYYYTREYYFKCLKMSFVGMKKKTIQFR